MPFLSISAKPPASARVVFALTRHRLAVSLAIILGSYLLAFAGGALAADFLISRNVAVVFAVVVAFATVAAWCAVSPPWLSARATQAHVEAALWSATPDERVHLVARIEGRLRNPYWTSAITLSELAAMFSQARAEYGDRAQLRRSTDAHERRALVELVAGLSLRASPDAGQQVRT